MRARFASDVDPRRLRINIRYTNVRKTPPDVAAAYQQVVREVEESVKADSIEFHPKARLELEVVYSMPDRRSDLDGPHKRVQDAIAAGLKINDGRFDRITMIREVGEPGIRAMVATLDHHEAEQRPDPGDEDWIIYPGQPMGFFREDV